MCFSSPLIFAWLGTSLGEQGVVSFGAWLGGGWADGGRGMDGQEPAAATWLSESQAYGPDGSGPG